MKQQQTFEQLEAAIEAAELIMNHVDGHADAPGRWFMLTTEAKQTRVNAAWRLRRAAAMQRALNRLTA